MIQEIAYKKFLCKMKRILETEEFISVDEI